MLKAIPCDLSADKYAQVTSKLQDYTMALLKGLFLIRYVVNGLLRTYDTRLLKFGKLLCNFLVGL
jgi:hypothetical protein